MNRDTETRRKTPGHGTASPTVHRAGWVLVKPDTVIENGCLIIENGRITAAGNHDQMMAADGYYARAFRLQELEDAF